MTPAERQSAVAFALRNLLLDDRQPSPSALQAASDFMTGRRQAEALADQARHLEAKAEALTNALFLRTILVCQRPWATEGDLAELRAIHRRLLPGLPEERALRRPQPNDNTNLYPAAMLEQGAAAIGQELAAERNLASLDRPVFVERLAHYYDELSYLHPFADCDGMTLRIFLSRLSHDAGWDLDWGRADPTAHRRALQQALQGNTDDLQTLIAGMVRPVNPTRIFLIAGWDQGPAH
ncbi:Fic family protein [Bifidobacterium sp. W8113]|uniref:Fic family protein n=1 Tax=Bifidobacterium TaxID=1678 RepID=UPI0018DEC1B1|nr:MULTISPECIES: Fic family protein [Bifidobacterium]MBI0090704.1 Fic family protein [Bifidobacterium choladohabitans]MBI0125608.1 Fic family protein [Bifidobacterium choladohabitans]MBI0127176.1 Fic family protein [Bifidobacterium sp. W8103]MBI0137767.1 Fic family protein [Bifidobacterium sp. W8105]MBI0149262.1 Fic family protein [Bifidobacterium sp. W8107]